MFRFSAAILICTFGAAVAHGAFQWDTLPTPGTQLDLKYNNFEGVLDGDGGGGTGLLPDSTLDTLHGIFRITSIVDNNVNTYWSSNPGNGQDLVGYFLGYTAQAPIVNPVGAFPQTQTFGNGTLMIFDAGALNTFNAAFNTNDGGAVGHGAGYDGAVSGAPLFLSTVGVQGIAANPLVTLSSTVNNTTPLSGLGFGYLTIAGGSAAGYFGADLMDPAGVGGTPGSQDLRLQSNFNGVPTFPADPTAWPATSFDPISGIYVPEPASFAIWGMLGIAIGILVRRRTGR